MVNVSTLFYVLENFECNDGEIFNLEEIYELEQKYLNGLFGLIEKARPDVRPAVIEKILQSVSTD
jgi:hypothetical protein